MLVVTKGMKQGSVLPLFDICFDNLLSELYTVSNNVCISDYSFNVFDDVTALCTSMPRLQLLTDTCTNNALSWMFKVGFEKTNCIIIAPSGSLIVIVLIFVEGGR